MKWDFQPIGLRAYSALPFEVPLWLPNVTCAQLLALVTLPVCLFKNFINIVQLWKASKILVGVDLAERAAAREEKEKISDNPPY